MDLAIISLGGPGAKMIATEAAQFFDNVDLIDIKKIEVHVGEKGLEVLYDQKPLKDYHCIYARGSFKYALLQRAITESLHNKSYMPLQPHSFNVGHDKFLTSIFLKKNNVPTPGTYLALTTSSAKALLEEVNYPLIMKIPSGTHGKGVMFADTKSSAKTILDTLEVFKQPFLIQEYIETGKNKAEDIRVIVAGNKVLAAMKRKSSKEELRANIHMGGSGEKVNLSYEQEQIAIKAAKATGADLCGVDLLSSGKKTYVLEVNLSPGMKGITKATGKNVAADVAKFLYEQTDEFFAMKKEADVKGLIDSLDAEKKEILTNIQIKANRIILPEVITKVSGFIPEEEVSVNAVDGKVIIKTVSKKDS